MQSLFQPRSFEGSLRAWDHVTPALEGRAPDVVKKLLASFPFYALQGPPGTGKTTVLAHAVAAFLRVRPGSRILISAQSHFALDELGERLIGILQASSELKSGRDQILCVRVASSQASESVRKGMQDYFDSAHAQRCVKQIERLPRQLSTQVDWRSTQMRPLLELVVEWAGTAGRAQWEIQDRIWRGSNIVFATCGTCTETILGHCDEYDAFDWVVVEEAAKAWPAELVMPMVLGHKWTLVGDHQQLPPYGELEIWQILEAFLHSPRREVRELADDSADFRKALELFRHLFEESTNRAVRDERAKPVDTLDRQFRMADDIRKIIAEVFYPKINYNSASHLVTDGPTHGLFAPDYVRKRSIVWVDTSASSKCRHEEPHWKNKGEANVVSELVQALRPIPVVGHGKERESRLAILSPYQHQNHLIRSELPSEYTGLVHTTDSFQGREADIVVVSLVRTNDHPAEETLDRIGHVGSAQRANVLLSRARRLLIVVGDFGHFKRTLGSPWQQVCRMLEKSEGVVRWPGEDDT
jgi:DNA polymerase III delta prime subunit